MQIISIAVTVIFTALVLFMGYRGYRKGLNHGLANLIKTVCAALLSYLITFLVTPVVNAGEIIKGSLPEIFASVANFADEAAAVQLLSSLANIIVTPIIFIVVFGLMNIILWIVQSIVMKKIKPDENMGTGKRIIGGVANAVKAFVVICLCLLPLAAIAGTLGSAIDTVALHPKHQVAADEVAKIGNEDMNYEFLGQSVIKNGLLSKSGIQALKDTYISPASDNLYIKAAYCAPMRAFANSMAHISSTKNCILDAADLAELVLSSDAVYIGTNIAKTGDLSLLEHSEIDEGFFAELFEIMYNSRDLKGFIPYVTCLPLTLVSEGLDIPKPTATPLPEMTDEDLKNEGAVFAYMLSGLEPVMNTVKSLGNGVESISNISDLDLVSLGKYLDNIRNSKFISASADEFIINALHSSSFQSLGSLATVIETHFKQDIDRKSNGDASQKLVLEDVFKTVQEVLSIINGYQSGEYTLEDLEKSLSTLNTALRANGMTAATLLKDIINTNNADGTGSIIPDGGSSGSALSQKVVSFFVDRLSENEIKEENMSAEASSVDFMLQIATEVSKDEGMTFDSFIDICTSSASTSNMDVNGLVDSVADSTFVSDAISSIVYDTDENGQTVINEDIQNLTSTVTSENKAQFEDFCKSTYVAVAENKDYDQEQLGTVKDNINSIGSIIGVEINESQFDSWLNEASSQAPSALEKPEASIPDDIASQIPDGVEIPESIPDGIVDKLPDGIKLP